MLLSSHNQLREGNQSETLRRSTYEQAHRDTIDDIVYVVETNGTRRSFTKRHLTVALIERTKDNYLNTQPYLATGTRELKRLTDEQIIQLNGNEVALRVIPEGSEFLMGWRSGDIQRFLSGETIVPSVAFNTIHDPAGI